MTGRLIRVLLIEDSKDDALLMERTLAREGWTPFVERVETAEELVKAIGHGRWDVIISDYYLPKFDALSALHLIRWMKVDTPFLLVSGTAGEEQGIATLKEGANDFIKKGNLLRLIPALERELRIAAERHEHERMKDALEWAESRFRSLFSAASDAILIIDSKGLILDLNPAGQAVLAPGAPSARGRNLRDYIPPFYLHALQAQIGSALENEAHDPVEIEVTTQGGSRRILSVRAQTFDPMEGGRVLELIIRDDTLRKELEMRLLEAERLAGVGQIAAVLAHEVNTPLTNLALLAARISKRETDPEVKAMLAKMDNQRQKVSELIANLMRFARSQHPEPRDLDVWPVIEEVAQDLAPRRGSDVNLLADRGPDPVIVRVDPAHLREILVNLVKNAIEATDRGSVSIRIQESGAEISVLVSDTGSGMDSGTVNRLFTPFFTTKGDSGGTGLGLAWSQSLAVANRGSIRVSSNPGRGTTMTLTLPKGDSPSPGMPVEAKVTS